jgi:hypothetical protein
MTAPNYGRQAKGKTIKSISIESDLADWIQKQADKSGVSFSAFVNEYFREEKSPQSQGLTKQDADDVIAAAYKEIEKKAENGRKSK